MRLGESLFNSEAPFNLSDSCNCTELPLAIRSIVERKKISIGFQLHIFILAPIDTYTKQPHVKRRKLFYDVAAVSSVEMPSEKSLM